MLAFEGEYMTRREFRSLVPPAEAHEAIESLSFGAGTERVPLSEAHDRVLAERVDAGIDVPGFDRAAMDGYAVRAADTFEAGGAESVSLPVTGTVHAGSSPDVIVDSGVAAGIATGAVMPAGADAVVPVEQTVEDESEGEDRVEIRAAVTPGEHVMLRGADIAGGDRALSPGTRLGPRHVGLLAALGRERVPVRERPQVAVVSTGDELVQPGDPLDARSGQIYDVNSHSIASAVRAAGGEPAVYETATDSREALRAVLDRATEACSLVLTSGSTSAGSTDLLYRLLEDEGEKLVHGVSVKPGRPLLVGRLFGTAYVGLPGYPVSALMTFTQFVAPQLRAASRSATEPEREIPTTSRGTVGDSSSGGGTSNGTVGGSGSDTGSAGAGAIRASLRTRVRYDGGRLRLLPVGLVEDGNGSLVAYAPETGSGATTTLAETDGFVRMAPERSLFSPGTEVTVEQFDTSDPLPSLLGVGDPDPVVFALLDRLQTSRYLRLGETDARRWFDDSVPDILVTTGADDAPGEQVARWEREWGLAVPDGNPDSVDGSERLTDGDLLFANLGTALSVREVFDTHTESTGVVVEDIDGYHRGLPGVESAVRTVAAGDADVGLGLQTTAVDHGLGFVPLGTQTVRVAVAPSRRGKPEVAALEDLFERTLPDLLGETAGYSQR
ncbi:MAG: molybdenum cofactor synthesis domain protein [halophilic archaeon J07HX64]|jgi:molybdenum cofactor synthesis domain|nr:MAG: molybdenum cofactor synthesis domain protein [halophilic archaeon J07HX64]